jgi:hypothetical protein
VSGQGSPGKQKERKKDCENAFFALLVQAYLIISMDVWGA